MPTYDITDRAVQSLGVIAASAGSDPGTVGYDWLIAGLPFRSYADANSAYERALAPIRKQQVDQSANPGEQSLDSWWLRSQTDWSGGAGLSFMEPADDERVQRSFYTSAGVNPWRIGDLSLLRAMTSQRTISGSATSYLTKYYSSSVAGMYHGSGTTIEKWDGTSWSATTGFSGTVAGILAAGGNIVATNSTGAIYNTTAGGTTFASLWTTANGATKSWWVKQRMITAQGAKLWELSPSTGGNLDTTSPYYTHPDSTWKWTSVFEAPGAILAAGYGAAGSAVYKFVLQTSGALPTISGAITTAEFPVGEYITQGFSYLGAFVALATNVGVRVGTIDADSNITYGPLTYTGTTYGTFQPYSRFVWIGVADAGEGRPGLIRIDLSDIGQDGRAPWANDVRFPSGVSTSPDAIAILGEEQIYAATAGVVYGCTASSNLEASGWLRTGYVRYGTIEPKNFESVKIEVTKPMSGSITISSVDKDGNTTQLGNYGSTSSTDEALKITVPTSPQKHLALLFTLARDSTTLTAGPTLENWQMRAVPSPSRAEIQQIPLMCMDFEQDDYGQSYGYEGSALARWTALRDAVNDSRSVRVQNLWTGETTVCVVEDLSFRQPGLNSKASSFGGVILCTVRSL